jgi:hypothetical protein
MKNVLLSLLAVVLLTSAWGCHDKHNNNTGQSEKQDRIDVTTGHPPEKH